MIDKNDPRLTSFVLGELDRQSTAEVSAAIEASPELQRAVKEIEKATALLGDIFQSEPPLALREDQRAALRQSANAHLVSPSGQTRRVQTASHSTGTRGWFAEYRSSLLAFAAALMLLIAGTLYYEPLKPTVSQLERVSDNAKIDALAGEAEDSNSASAGLKMDVEKASEMADVEPMESTSDEMLAPRLPKPAARSADLMVIRQADGKQLGGGGGLGGGGFGVNEAGRNRAMMRSRPMNAADGFDVIPKESPGAVAALKDPGEAKSNLDVSPNLASVDPAKAKTASRMNEAAVAFPAPAVEPLAPIAEASRGVEGEPLSVELAASQRLIENVNQVLGQSTLNSLDFQVETKARSFVVDMPMFETQLEQSSGLKVVDAGGGNPVTENYQQSRPVTKMVTRPTTVLFVQPVVKLEPRAAESLVEQLASSVDPEEKMMLSFEELIGIEGEVLVASDRDDDGSQVNDPAGELANSLPGSEGLGRGGFSKKEAQVNSMERRASQAMVKYLRTQIERQTVLGRQNGERLGEEKDRTRRPGSTTAVNGQKAEAAVLESKQDGALQAEDDESARVSREVEATGAEESAAVTIHWQKVRSVEELDCSELVKQLKSLLEKRNRRVRGQQR